VARRDLDRQHKGAAAQRPTTLCIGKSGSDPLPSGVRTYALVGQPPVLREWWPRDHRSAISVISPQAKRYLHCQDSALNAEDVTTFLEHLLREVPGRLVSIWEGSPIPRSHVIKESLADGAAQRLHLARLPA
jgi:hypothetical protein